MLGNTRQLLAGSLATVLLLVAVPQGWCECCYPNHLRLKHGHQQEVARCSDWSEPDPFCGRGACDLDGCNCVGGCRLGLSDPLRGRRVGRVQDMSLLDVVKRLSMSGSDDFLRKVGVASRPRRPCTRHQPVERVTRDLRTDC